MQKAKKYLTISAFVLPCVILAAWLLYLCFMASEVAVHFNIEGQVTRFGSKYEYLIVAGLFYIFPLIMAIIFHKVKMSDNLRLVGLSSSVVMSVAFLAVSIYFFVIVTQKSVSLIFLFENRISFILTLMGALFVILSHILPFVYNRERLKNEIAKKYAVIIDILIGVCGFVIMLGTLLLNNYYSFIVFFLSILVAIAIWYIFQAVMQSKVKESE